MDKKEIKATPECFRTATLTPILVEESEHVQIEFLGKQVNNPSDFKKNIKGSLLIKKKNKDIETFDDNEKFTRRDISSKDLVEICFDTKATYKLAKGLYEYYKLFSGKSINPYDEVIYVEEDKQLELVRSILSNDERLAEIITKIDVNTLNVALNIETLKRVRDTMNENMENDQETAFWQPFFEDNAWVLSQLFHAPVMFFSGKRYVGGKGIDNQGGKYTDMIYKNDITDNVAIIEIKSPKKPIIHDKYRQSYIFDAELVGGINQLLNQKDTLIKNYKNLLAEADPDESYRATNIESILVYGNIGKLDRNEKDAFECYRNELRSIRLVGFDELLMRINNLLKLLENHKETLEKSNDI